jgi:DNA replication protein DnaC
MARLDDNKRCLDCGGQWRWSDRQQGWIACQCIYGGPPANLPKPVAKAGLNANAIINRTAYEQAQTYCKLFQVDFDGSWSCETHRPGLYIFGPTGVGKTYMAAGIVKQLQTEGWTVKWMTAREYLAAIKAEFEIPGEEGVTDAGIREANLLVLDDVGAEDPTDYNNNKLADLIGTRHQRLAPIIVTTNTSLNATRLDRRTQSRLYELCEQIELTGKDQRI